MLAQCTMHTNTTSYLQHTRWIYGRCMLVKAFAFTMEWNGVLYEFVWITSKLWTSRVQSKWHLPVYICTFVLLYSSCMAWRWVLWTFRAYICTDKIVRRYTKYVCRKLVIVIPSRHRPTRTSYAHSQMDFFERFSIRKLLFFQRFPIKSLSFYEWF